MEQATGTQLGRDLSTLGEYEVVDGVVTGSLDYQTRWTEFNGSVVEEQSGYYVAINVSPWEGRKFRIDRTTGKGKAVAFNGDGIAICWLGDDEEKAKTAQSIVLIDADGSEEQLSLSGLTLNPVQSEEDGDGE